MSHTDSHGYDIILPSLDDTYNSDVVADAIDDTLGVINTQYKFNGLFPTNGIVAWTTQEFYDRVKSGYYYIETANDLLNIGADVTKIDIKGIVFISLGSGIDPNTELPYEKRVRINYSTYNTTKPYLSFYNILDSLSNSSSYYVGNVTGDNFLTTLFRGTLTGDATGEWDYAKISSLDEGYYKILPTDAFIFINLDIDDTKIDNEGMIYLYTCDDRVYLEYTAYYGTKLYNKYLSCWITGSHSTKYIADGDEVYTAITANTDDITDLKAMPDENTGGFSVSRILLKNPSNVSYYQTANEGLVKINEGNAVKPSFALPVETPTQLIYGSPLTLSSITEWPQNIITPADSLIFDNANNTFVENASLNQLNIWRLIFSFTKIANDAPNMVVTLSNPNPSSSFVNTVGQVITKKLATGQATFLIHTYADSLSQPSFGDPNAVGYEIFVEVFDKALTNLTLESVARYNPFKITR